MPNIAAIMNGHNKKALNSQEHVHHTDFIMKPRGIIVLISQDNHQNVLIILNSTLKY